MMKLVFFYIVLQIIYSSRGLNLEKSVRFVSRRAGPTDYEVSELFEMIFPQRQAIGDGRVIDVDHFWVLHEHVGHAGKAKDTHEQCLILAQLW